MSAKYKQYLITFNLYDGTMRSVPIEIPIGDPGEPGGYYKPETEQISDTEFRVSFIPSKDGMPPVDPVTMYSFSPRLTVTETEEGAEVTATDNFGTNTVVILNGKNGKTPVKGIDYSDGYSIYGLNDKLFAPTDEELMTMHDISLVKTEGRTLQKNDFVISNNGILGRVAGFASNNTKAVILPILAVGGSDGFSPTATVTRETDGVKITITDKNGTTTQTVPIGAEGNSIYYMDFEVEYPVPDDGGIRSFMVQLGALTNRGKGIKPGDIIVASNGTLCKVKSVSDKNVSYDPIGTIKGVVSEYVGYSVYYLSLNAEYETESKQYLASKTYLSNDGNGVKVGDLLISSNGVLCKVTSVGESLVHYETIANIGGNDSGGKDGYSIYYIDLVVPFPWESEEDGVTAISKLSDGDGVKVGDLVVSSNGILCKVTAVFKESDRMRIRPIANISGSDNDSGGDSDVLVVTVTDNIASHSPAEIGEAYSEGKAVYLLNNRYVIPLSYYRDDVAYFNIPLNLSGTEPDINLILKQYSVNADKSVSLSASSRNLPPCPTDEDEGKVLTAKNGDFVWSEHSGGNVAYDEAQNLTDEQKAQARENIGAQPKGNYLTEVPEGYAKKTDIPSLDGYAKTTDIPSLDGYAKTEDVPTDAEIIQLIKNNVPESSGGGIAVTGATVGQTVKISEVDENGVPTAWLPTDFPSGGGGSGGEWKHIASVTLEETTAYIMQEISGGYNNVLLEFTNLLRAEGNSSAISVSINNTPSSGKSVYSFGAFVHNSSASSGFVEFEKLLNSVRTICTGKNASGNGAGSGVGLILTNTGDIATIGVSLSGYATSKMAAGAVFNFYGR